MRKQFTYLFVIALMAMGNQGVLQAQDTYKKYHIHEDFSSNALPNKPSAWSINTTNSSSQTTNVYGGAGTVAWTSEMLTISASNGSGTRGAEIFFPTPQSNETMAGYEVFNMEFDWTINAATVAAKNSLGLIFMDAARTKDKPLPIFGLYLAGTDGFFHYWNMDLVCGDYGAVYTTGNGGGGFRRQGNNADETNTINESTRTSIAYTVGSTYHIRVSLNFTTKEVVSLTITDADNPENTGTITNQPFIDSDATNIGVLSIINTRGGNIGNGDNVTFAAYFDNFDIYVNEISLGRRDVTVNYLDQDGQQAKAPRVIPQQEVSLAYYALETDKNSFVEGDNYYAYNAAETTSESVVVELDGVNAINLVFKKSPAATGTYTWTGTTSVYWDELDNNFSIDGGSNVSYQNGNSVAFSNESIESKEINVPQTILLGSGNVTVSTDGYALTGDGNLTGTGNLILNPGNAGTVILGIGSNLEAQLQTGSVHIKNAATASKYTAADNVSFLIDANLSTPIEGAGGELNFNVLSEAFSSPAITNVSKVNITLSVAGRLKSADWATEWTGSVPENTEVNAINGIEDASIAGFGVNNTFLEKAKVNLGDNIRLVRYYNENAQGTDTLRIGALNGTAASVIEGGFIDGRKSTYMFGGLNTDAEFAGTIRSFIKNDTAIVTSRTSTSRTFLYKIGTGKWTLSGNSPEHSGNIVVREGTLAIGGSLIAAIDTVTIENGATLDVSGSFGIKEAYVNGTFKNTGISDLQYMYLQEGGILEGGINLSANLDLYKATLKLTVADSHTADAYDVVNIAGDFVVNEECTLDITVLKATTGDKIILINAPNGMQAATDQGFDQILINGKSITEQTACVWRPETGELEFTEDISVGIATVGTAKIVQATQYYNLTGMQVTKDATGFVIKKITYTDGSIETVKAFVKEK
ncbi:MAG: hypothetical protein LBB85_08135 [Dysgonamonadaceae bacterium]|jgi:autotransporter-associated beta strand protein|nr:hypothetical protein [Dysgonamonadaceae bacterium]